VDIFGCSPEDVHDDFSPITKVILPEDLNFVVNSIMESAEHLTTWHCEYRVQIPGQSIRKKHKLLILKLVELLLQIFYLSLMPFI
jgi:hypothetical protein